MGVEIVDVHVVEVEVGGVWNWFGGVNLAGHGTLQYRRRQTKSTFAETLLAYHTGVDVNDEVDRIQVAQEHNIMISLPYTIISKVSDIPHPSHR